jgi:hypothetical protein
MSRKCILVLLFSLSFLIGGRQGDLPPTSVDETIVELFLVENAGQLVAGQCAPVSNISANGSTCANSVTSYYANAAWNVTRICIVIPTLSWTTTEACDVDVDFGGSTTTTFLIGDDGLTAIGDSLCVTSLTDSTLAINDLVIVRHDSPAADHCQNKAACVCEAANGVNYKIQIFGYRP